MFWRSRPVAWIVDRSESPSWTELNAIRPDVLGYAAAEAAWISAARKMAAAIATDMDRVLIVRYSRIARSDR